MPPRADDEPALGTYNTPLSFAPSGAPSPPGENTIKVFQPSGGLHDHPKSNITLGHYLVRRSGCYVADEPHHTQQIYVGRGTNPSRYKPNSIILIVRGARTPPDNIPWQPFSLKLQAIFDL